MRAILKKMLSPLAGKRKYQKLFESLHVLSLQGMNIGGGGSTDSSGEKKAIEYISSHFNEPGNIIVFDVGANIGHYTLLLNDVFKGRTGVFSFEPSAKTYQKFIANTKNVANLKHYNFGFGNTDAMITLFSNADESGLASLYQRRLDHYNINMNKSEDIVIKTIDGFCQENDVRHINFLKIDVEGHEIKVLEGAKKMLESNSIDFIQFEFGGCNIDSKTYFQDFYYLLKGKYQLYRIVKDGLFKIDEYKEMYEAFMTTNYLAKRIGL